MTKISCVEPLSRVIGILSKEGLLSITVSRNAFHVVKLILHILLNMTCSILIFMNGINAIRAGNVKELTRASCIFLPVFILLIKVTVIVQKKEKIVSLLDYLRSDVFNNHSEELNVYIKFVYRTSEIIWKYYTILTTGYNIVVFVSTGSNTKAMPIPPPFNVGKYVLVYKIIHFIISIYLSANSICIDVLFMSSLGICVSQLYILERRLIHVFEEAKETCKDRDTKEMYLYEEEVLRFCIVLQENLSQYVDKLSAILSLPLFCQYLCGCFIICNLVLQLTIMGERSTSNILTGVAYALITFSQMAVYHWLGNEIIVKSGNIINACYLSRWYKLHHRSKKILMMIMERAKRPLVVQLFNFVYVSLESLGVIVQWSYSLFALIRARYN